MVNFLMTTVGVLIFLFVFWKKLREDYAAEIIFLAGAYILIGLFVGLIISLKFFPLWLFWGSFLGVLAGFGLSVLKLRVRTYETLEAGVVAFLPWLSLFFLGDAVKNSSSTSFAAFLAVLLLIFIYYFLDLHYKEFTWYKSGRIGFSGLTVLGLFFLIRSATSIVFPSVLSFVGKYESFVSGVFAFVAFLFVFDLGRKEV